MTWETDAWNANRPYPPSMTEFPPEPPPLRDDQVDSVITWLSATADWLRHEHSAAAAHGHVPSAEALANLRLYEGSALLFREAYDRL